MNKKLIISAVALAAVAVHVGTQIKVDAITFGLLCIGLLPWVADVIKMVEIPGIGKVEFQDLAKRVDRAVTTGEIHEAEIQHQREKLDTLARYSMSASIYKHLWWIANKPEYKYHDEPFFRREMYFLRDGGYVKPRGNREFLDFGPEADNQNLSEIAEPTLAGKIVLDLRGEP